MIDDFSPNEKDDSASLHGSTDARISILIHNRSTIFCGTVNGDIAAFPFAKNVPAKIINGAHGGLITALSLFKHQGCLFALSSASDKVVKLWKVTERKEVDLELCDVFSSWHKDSITCCCYFEDINNMALEFTSILSGSDDNNVILWKGNHQQVFQGLQTTVVNVNYSDTAILGCGRDGSIFIWSREGKILSSIPGLQQSSAVFTFDVTKDDTGNFDIIFAFVNTDGSVVIKQPLQNLPLCTLEGHSKPVTSCCIANDGEILSSSFDGSINVWKLPTDIQERNKSKHSGAITALDLSLNDFVLSCDSHGNVILWKINYSSDFSPLEYLSKKVYTGGFVKDVIFLKDTYFACGVTLYSENEEKYLIDVLSYKEITSKDENKPTYVIEGKSSHFMESEIMCIDYSEENDALVVGLKSGKCVFITSKLKKQINMHTEWIMAVKVSQDANLVNNLYISFENGEIWCLSLSEIMEKKEVAKKKIFKASYLVNNPACITAVNSSKGQVYSGDTHGNLTIYSDESTHSTIMGHTDCVTGLCVYGDNIYTSSLDKVVKGWNYKTLEQVCEYHSSVPITCLSGPKNLNDISSTVSHTLLIGTASGLVHLLKVHQKN